MILRHSEERSDAAFAAFIRFTVSVLAAGAAASIQWDGIQREWLLFPTWQALAGQVFSLALVVFAIWQLVRAMYDPLVRRMIVGAAGLTGIVLFAVAGLYAATGMWGIVAMWIGIGWLEVTRRTWPREAFRGPRLRSDTLEPPKKAVRS